MNPSLLLIPDRYKAAKLYSQIPDSGAGDLDFARASVATRVNASGLIESVASGVPRLDYTGGGCPSLLSEPQRTNKCPDSANYGNSFLNTTATRNVVSAPTGLAEADRVLDDNTNGEHLLGQNFDSILNAQPYTVSCFFKDDGTGGRAVIRFFVGSWTYGVYNLANGTVTATDGVGTASIQNYGNGWYRCILTATASTDYTPMVTQLGVANSSNNFSYQGATSLGVYFWGYQAEQGSYVSSIIPTNGSSVTRLADTASKTGISSLIGQSEGVLFMEFDLPSLASAGSYASIELNDGTANNLIYFAYYSDGRIQAVVFVSGSLTVNIDLPSYGLTVGTHKIAIAYKLNDYVLFVDGALAGSDTSSAVPATSKLDLFTGVGATQEYNLAALYTTRLSNAELATLTAL
jgi:hypothetical protein